MNQADNSATAFKATANEKKKRLIAVRGRVQKSIVQLLHSFDCVIDNEMEQSFSSVTDEFIRRAYDFDPTIGEEAVYQASRNVMIMNTFQMHLGKAVTLTPSVFAYSLLYPYTDNYLDAAEIDRQSKDDANNRLQLRLAGVPVTPKNCHERTINSLVGMIEAEFGRNEFPLVYESLLAIQSAQRRSVKQQDAACRLTPEELLDVSFEKGGASVLADGYLVAGCLARDDAEFFFRFGVLLQLIDDLQDIHEDLALGQRTLVGAAAAEGYLDDFTNRLLSYMSSVLEPSAQEQEKLYRLIERSCRLLILEAMASNYEIYSQAYLVTMERRSPVRFDYLRTVKKRLRERWNIDETEAVRCVPESRRFFSRLQYR